MASLLYPCSSVALCVAATLQAMPNGHPLNPVGHTYDSCPSMVIAVDGSEWFAWHAYQSGRDQVRVRKVVADGSVSVDATLSTGHVNGPPALAAGADGSVWVFWSNYDEGRWRIIAREIRGDSVQEPVTLSSTAGDAVHPSAISSDHGSMIAVWTCRKNGRFVIQSSTLRRGQWGPTYDVSRATYDAYRPVVAAAQSDVWVFWDQYHRGNYEVVGRRISPRLGATGRVSPNDEYCLKPTAIGTAQGIYVAWLQKQDVVGGPGVVSQLHTLHAAVRRGAAWVPISENEPAAELTHGLMAKIEPQVVPTGGYLGRRTAPMWIHDRQHAWLLWERKTDHQGSTAFVSGDLLACRIDADEWDEPVVLYRGMVDYHVAHPRRPRHGRALVAASNVPTLHRRQYRRAEISLRKTSAFQQDEWTGWRPVTLPIPGELKERRALRVGEKKFELYWADLHCHSSLSADAEGEPDELLHYARDRARVDVVLFSNNDFYIVPMTQREYEWGNTLARAMTRPGEFLALQGYEWTSRIPGTPDAGLADPGNWTHPYQNRSTPNHRTVIYPDSGGPIVRFTEVGNDIRALHEVVARSQGLTLTQHARFEPTGHDVEVAMEVTAGWGRYIARHPSSFHEPLNRGRRLGFVANGDSHRRAPGLSGALTGIYAEELTVPAVLDALRQRRCFATDGSRIFVDARGESDRGSAFMGGQLTSHARRVSHSLTAIGTRVIETATLVRNGTDLKRFAGNGTRELRVAYNDSDLEPGRYWYYWRVAQERPAPPLSGNLMSAFGHLAWSSPLTVDVISVQPK